MLHGVAMESTRTSQTNINFQEISICHDSFLGMNVINENLVVEGDNLYANLSNDLSTSYAANTDYEKCGYLKLNHFLADCSRCPKTFFYTSCIHAVNDLIVHAFEIA